jgi:hypothetical protein
MKKANERHHRSTKRRRAPRLPDWAPLEYAPNNEQGVVFLFSHFARKFGLRVELIRTGFPDCIAYKDGDEIKIEFEYKSRNFKAHNHQGKHCDWIVCWEHNWPAVPKHLRVVELRREFGLGFNVWFQPVTIYKGENYADDLTRGKYFRQWSVPSLAAVGDLLLYYRTAKCNEPHSCVQDIFRVVSPVEHIQAGWKRGKDYMADIRRVFTLDAPLHLSQLREDSVLQNAGFVRGMMQGRYRATAYWPDLYRLIIKLNPSLKAKLHKKYPPERVA